MVEQKQALESLAVPLLNLRYTQELRRLRSASFWTTVNTEDKDKGQNLQYISTRRNLIPDNRLECKTFKAECISRHNNIQKYISLRQTISSQLLKLMSLLDKTMMPLIS
mmetsp:Transcript_23497/g.34868  ORF Transcript_23497/g.34868 Transcript_23497/m.34868 type:complete len:109 (-) Transcript_23497:81-407(-)